MHKSLKYNGFTLMECLIVVVALGVLASVAIPRMVGPNRTIIASEGKQTLMAMLTAQKRYLLEKGAYANQTSSLDITVPTSKYFNAPSVAADVNNLSQACDISGVDYCLCIDGSGNIYCCTTTTGCASIGCNNSGTYAGGPGNFLCK